ncbi:unnamed protein product [Closterium sp. NIES-54]
MGKHRTVHRELQEKGVRIERRSQVLQLQKRAQPSRDSALECIGTEIAVEGVMGGIEEIGWTEGKGALLKVRTGSTTTRWHGWWESAGALQWYYGCMCMVSLPDGMVALQHYPMAWLHCSITRWRGCIAALPDGMVALQHYPMAWLHCSITRCITRWRGCIAALPDALPDGMVALQHYPMAWLHCITTRWHGCITT